MPSIGPQMPPDMGKRKRSTSSPDPKEDAAKNHDEINLEDSDSDSDDMGPKMPNSQQPSRPSVDKTPSNKRPRIGPSLPPVATTSNTSEINLDLDSDSDHGSAPLPSQNAPSKPSDTGKARIIGPSRPPPLTVQPQDQTPDLAPPPQQGSDSDSDSDDDYGPALPSAHTSNHGNKLIDDMEARQKITDSEPRRDDWMLAPPPDSSGFNPDTSKLKSRGFSSGRNKGSQSAGSSNSISSIWTETPEEKKRRLQNAVLGRAESANTSTASKTKTQAELQREEDQRRRINAYTAQTRGKSLYDQRQEQLRGADGSTKKDSALEEDDPSKRAFDIQKDMAIGGRLGESQKREMLKKASNFGDRFQKGSYL